MTLTNQKGILKQNVAEKSCGIISWKKYLQIKDFAILSRTFQATWIPKALLDAEWFVILGGIQLTTIDNG